MSDRDRRILNNDGNIGLRQYCVSCRKVMIQEFVDILRMYPCERREYERERYIMYHLKKYEEKLKNENVL